MEEKNTKVIIETSADLFKIPLEVIKKTKLYDFKGKYFQKLYEEALKIERSNGKIEVQDSSPSQINIEYISFEISYSTKYGQNLFIIGNIDILGNWEEIYSFPLKHFKENDIDKWRGTIPFIESFEFKFIVREDNKVTRWENGDDRKFNYNLKKSFENQNFNDPNINYDNSVPNTIKLICKWK